MTDNVKGLFAAPTTVQSQEAQTDEDLQRK
jgi:hypothetical protein